MAIALASILLGCIALGAESDGDVVEPRATPSPQYVIPDADRTPDVEPAPLTSITIQRNHCYGVCPVYRLSLDHLGEVLYEGIDHVSTLEPVGAMLSEEQTLSLLAEFATVDLASIPKKCEWENTGELHRSTLTVTLRRGESEQSVELRTYCDDAGTSSLFAAARRLDHAVDVDSWNGEIFRCGVINDRVHFAHNRADAESIVQPKVLTEIVSSFQRYAVIPGFKITVWGSRTPEESRSVAMKRAKLLTRMLVDDGMDPRVLVPHAFDQPDAESKLGGVRFQVFIPGCFDTNHIVLPASTAFVGSKR